MTKSNVAKLRQFAQIGLPKILSNQRDIMQIISAFLERLLLNYSIYQKKRKNSLKKN